MSSRVGGAVLALTAAALLAVPMATSIAMDAGGWWSGHPTITMKGGKPEKRDRMKIDVGFFGATGCTSGGENEKCEHLNDKLPAGFTWTALAEAILTGVASVIAIGLGITSLQGNEGRKVLAKLMAAALALSVVGGIALVLQGPKFKGGTDVSVPFAWIGGFGMFLGAVACAGISSVLATREVRVRAPKTQAVRQPKPPKPAKQPKPPKIKPQPVTVAQMRPSQPHEPYDVQALMAQDALRPAALGPEPMLGRQSDPYAATMNQPPPNSQQPLFQQAPQLRPLYEAQGDGFPSVAPAQLPMRPPTPISREELGAMMHGEINNPAAAIVEQRNSKPPTIPPHAFPPATPPVFPQQTFPPQQFPPPQPLFPQHPPAVVMSTKPATIPPGVSAAQTMPPPSVVSGELPSLPNVASSMVPAPIGSVVPEMANPNESQRSKPVTLPPPKVAPALGSNGPRPSVPMPRPTAIGTVPAAARTSGTIPPAMGKSKSQPTIAAAVVPPPPPAIPAPPTFLKPDRSETEGEDFDSATAQSKSPGESTDATAKPFESEEPVAMLPIHPLVAAESHDDDEAKTVRAPSTKIAKAMDDMHEAVTVRAPSKKPPDDLHEAVTVRAPKTPKPKLDDDDDEAKTTHVPKADRASAKEIGLSTGDSTIQLQKEDPVETSAALPGSIADTPDPEPPVPAPPVIVPTLTSMARALRQKRAAERQRERTETNLKAVAAGGGDVDNDAPIAPPTKVPITTAPSTLPPPNATQTATSGPSPACPQCEAPMAWVEEHLRFYCKACRMYF